MLQSLSAPKKLPALEYHPSTAVTQENEAKTRFSWRIENFVAFKEIMETRKIFSRYKSLRNISPFSTIILTFPLASFGRPLSLIDACQLVSLPDLSLFLNIRVQASLERRWTETRLLLSRFFSVEGCDLRIGVYESFDTLCIYLESDAFGSGLERNYWVKYRIAILNQKHPERTEWKEAAICTKTWNNSVLQFMKV